MTTKRFVGVFLYLFICSIIFGSVGVLALQCVELMVFLPLSKTTIFVVLYIGIIVGISALANALMKWIDKNIEYGQDERLNV